MSSVTVSIKPHKQENWNAFKIDAVNLLYKIISISWIKFQVWAAATYMLYYRNVCFGASLLQMLCDGWVDCKSVNKIPLLNWIGMCSTWKKFSIDSRTR